MAISLPCGTTDVSRSTAQPDAVRGAILHFLSDPADDGRRAIEYIDDGALLLRDGKIAACGPADALLAQLPRDSIIDDYRGHLILPGLIDTHVHYAQVDMIASFGEQLLDWLNKYTFPAEQRFADPVHAREVAAFFCDELLRNGTTTAMIFATVHGVSVDALFVAARERRMRIITGKVMMDRNCPDTLRDSADGGEAEIRRLIEKWHGTERLLYAVTPRFAPTSTPQQMRLAGRLFAEYPDIYLQSHLAENSQEVAWARTLYPEARSYLGVYDDYRQTGERALYAHGIWIDDDDRRRIAETGTTISFCPASNLFLGSGLFDLDKARSHGMRVGIGTDVGGGTSLSILKTLGEAYKVLQLGGQSLSPLQAFYLATLGGARSLYLDAQIGNFLPGKEADFIVMNMHGTPLLARRIAAAATLEDKLFVLMMLGDDRVVSATYLLGQPAWRRA